MAAKTGIAFDPQAVVDLSAGVKALASNLQNTMDSVEVTFKQLEGDEIIGDSAQKTPIIEGIKTARDAYAAVNEKLIRMVNTIDNVCTDLGIAMNKNIKTNEDAVSVIGAASKRAKEATGANA